jgi:hypothetical protein
MENNPRSPAFLEKAVLGHWTYGWETMNNLQADLLPDLPGICNPLGAAEAATQCTSVAIIVKLERN